MKSENKLIGAGLLTAITASLCCITPLLALIAGTSGIASTFSWIEPFLALLGIKNLNLKKKSTVIVRRTKNQNLFNQGNF